MLQACGGGGGGGSKSSTTITDNLAGPGEVLDPVGTVTKPSGGTQEAGAGNSGNVGSGASGGQNVGGGAVGYVAVARQYKVPATDAEAVRFLLQAQFSASDSEIVALKSQGYAAWLSAAMQIPRGQRAWDWLNDKGYGVLDGNQFHFTPYQTDFALWYQLMKAPDAVRTRVTLALSEIFSVSTNGVDYFWLAYLMTAWWDTLADGALGNFRDLLENITLNPAMGMYLNMRGSQKENAQGRQPDENYAREVMQLMSIGLIKLNQDGSQVVSGGVPVETYSQEDVSGLARAFSGYDFDMTGGTPTWFYGLQVPDKVYTKKPMRLNASLHSSLEAKFLGTSIPAGTEGNAARKMALDAIFNHPNVGPFLGKQLIQRLVTSNPSPAHIYRVAAAFNDNGQGVRGDLAAVIAAVLLDDEARAPSSLASTTYGKLREPMVRFVQWGRTFGIRSGYNSWKIYDQSLLTQLGQSPCRSPSVFNFFRPGYVPPNTAMATKGALAPEFQIVNESSVSAYINYMYTVVRSGIYIGAPSVPQITSNASNGFDISVAYTSELAIAHDADALVARLNLLMSANQLSTATVSKIVAALKATNITAASNNDAKLNRIAGAALLVMASPEYLVQK